MYQPSLQFLEDMALDNISYLLETMYGFFRSKHPLCWVPEEVVPPLEYLFCLSRLDLAVHNHFYLYIK